MGCSTLSEQRWNTHIGRKETCLRLQNNETKKNKDAATEGKKLFGQDKRLKEDFGSFDQIDDADFFEYVARMYGLNTEQYWSKVVDSRNFYRDNKKSIDTGRKIVAKLGIKV